MLIYVSDLFLKSCVCSRNIMIVDVILLPIINVIFFFSVQKKIFSRKNILLCHYRYIFQRISG